jgi:hypothetical protein
MMLRLQSVSLGVVVGTLRAEPFVMPSEHFEHVSKTRVHKDSVSPFSKLHAEPADPCSRASATKLVRLSVPEVFLMLLRCT